MNCQRCRAESRPGARFCIKCGLPLACTHGGGDLPMGVKFCPDCGVPLGPAERRHVTFLFCDLVGSTKLLSKLDPEDYRRIVKTFQQAATKVITRFDGYVAQFLGDGLLVYFGWPEAHEDDAARAVRAGLGILDELDRVNAAALADRGVRLSARITMDAELGVAGEESLVTSKAPAVASHLLEVAAPDTVVITERVHRLVKGYFDVSPLGAVELKGEAHVAYKVLPEKILHTRLDAAGTAGLTPLKGRDDELSALFHLWRKIKTDRGQVVLLGGEAGIGKSRLVLALQEHVRTDEPKAWVTVCQASSRSKNTAFHPIVDLLEKIIFQRGANERADERLQKLEAWLSKNGQDLDEAVPLFAQLLSLPLPADRYPSSPVDPSHLPLVREAEVKKKVNTQQTLLRILRAQASVQPMFFLLEDLHWADPSTLELMNLLIQDVERPVERFPILVVLTFRPEEYAPPEKAPWASSECVTRKILGRLDRDASAEIANWTPGGARLPDSLLNEVLDRADGNPLFIEELSKLVREQSAADEKARALAIPDTLQSSLTARLDRLGHAKTIARIGAVLGREFSYDLLSAVSGIDDQVLTEALDQLVDAGILFFRSSRYVFKHALIQTAAYEQILKTSTLPDQHRRIAEVLTQQFGDLVVKQPELIAHHYTKAGLEKEAIPHLKEAGRRALERAANTEAIAHLSTALQFLRSSVPESDARSKLELELLCGLFPAYMAIKGWASAEVEATCGRARELGEQLKDFGSTYAAQWGRWTNYFLRGSLIEALETSDEVFKMAEKSANPMLLVTAHHAVGYSHFYRGNFLEVRKHAEAAHPPSIFKDEQAIRDNERAIIYTFQFSSTAALRIMHGSSLWMLGFPDQAPDLVRKGITLTRELEHRPSEAFALAASLLLHAFNLDVEGAAKTAEDLRRLAEEQGNEIWGPFAAMFNGWVLVEQGKADQGLDEIRSGIAGWQGARNHLNQTIVMAMLGRSLWKAGRPDEAIDTLDAEVKASATRQELLFAPELHRLKGEILVERGAIPESEACFESALAMARGQNALMLELRAATSLGRLWAQTGRAEAARRLVSEIYGRFTEGFGTADLRAARELLDRLAGGNFRPDEPKGPRRATF